MDVAVSHIKNQAETGCRQQVPRVRWVRFELSSNPGNEDAKVVGIAPSSRPPYLFKYLFARNKVPWMAKEDFDHSKLDPGEEDLVTIGMKHPPGGDVDREVTCHEWWWSIRPPDTADRRAQSSQHLFGPEWLGKIVISSGVERSDRFQLPATLRYHKDGQIRPCPKCLDNLRCI
jgi:hypothetical protein